MALELNEIEDNGMAVVQVAGDVHLYSSPQLRDAILKAIPRAKSGLGVDLSGVPYMDSSGVATLVEGRHTADGRKIGFAIIKPSQSVMKVLQLSKLDSYFEIRES